jgi:hypothetical protein
MPPENNSEINDFTFDLQNIEEIVQDNIIRCNFPNEISITKDSVMI